VTVKRVKGNSCGANLPVKFTDLAKGGKAKESTHKENNSPPKRGEH